MQNKRPLFAAAAIVTIVGTTAMLRPATRTHVPAASVQLAATTHLDIAAGRTLTTAATVKRTTTAPRATTGNTGTTVMATPAPAPTTRPTTPATTRPASTAGSATRALPAAQALPANQALPGSDSPTVVGAQVLGLVRYPWAALGYRIAFHGPRAGFFGLTDCHTHNIDIYVTPGQTLVQIEYVTAFEIAHAVDCTTNSPPRNATWAALRGFHLTGAWYPPCSCSENSYASGDFADVFALWQVGPAYSWRSTLAGPPNSQQMAALVPLMAG